MPRRWWDDPDDPMLDDDSAVPEPARRREPEPPRPVLRRQELPEDAGQIEERVRQRAEEEKRARLVANARMIEHEYAWEGLEPYRDSTGMLVSLSLLLQMGWTVGETPNGGKVLLRPAEAPRGEPQS